MTLVRFYYNPISDFDRLFEEALTAQLCAGASNCEAKSQASARQHAEIYRPRMNLHESKDDNAEMTAMFELPGLTSNDVTIEVHQNKLTVSAEAVSPGPEERQSHVVRERWSGKFSRTLRLPFGTRPEDVKAKMENGILTVTFPKTNPEQQAKRIVVE